MSMIEDPVLRNLVAKANANSFLSDPTTEVNRVRRLRQTKKEREEFLSQLNQLRSPEIDYKRLKDTDDRDLPWRSDWAKKRQTSVRLHVKFVGYTSDARVASYMFMVLSMKLFEKAREEALAEGLSGPSYVRYTNSFMSGAAHVLAKRFREMKGAPKVDADKKYALVTVKAKAVEEYYDALDLGTAAKSSARTDFDAYTKGAKEGQRVDINHGIEQATPKKLGR